MLNIKTMGQASHRLFFCFPLIKRLVIVNTIDATKLLRTRETSMIKSVWSLINYALERPLFSEHDSFLMDDEEDEIPVLESITDDDL